MPRSAHAAVRSPTTPHRHAPSRRAVAPIAARSPTFTAPARSHAVIEHRVAPAREHDVTPIDAGHALPVGYGSMLQAGFGGYVLRCLRQLAPAQRRQQVSREDDTLPAMLGQPGRKVLKDRIKSYTPEHPGVVVHAGPREEGRIAGAPHPQLRGGISNR